MSLLAERSEAQSAHGLRRYEYNEYQKYCTRKIQRYRGNFGLKRKKGSKGDSVDIPVDKEHARLLLLESERAWAQALGGMREASSTKNKSEKRRHAVMRLRRALEFAEKVQEAVKDDTPLAQENGLLYKLVIEGTLKYFENKFDRCAAVLTRVHGLVVALSQRFYEQASVLYALDGQVDPYRRYAYAQIEQEGDLQKAVEDENARLEASGVFPSKKEFQAEITWRDGIVASPKDAELGDLLIKSHSDIEKTLKDARESGEWSLMTKKKMKLFDETLLGLGNAVPLAKDLAEAAEQSASTLAVDKEYAAQMKRTYEYLQYHYLLITARRDIVLLITTRRRLALRTARARDRGRSNEVLFRKEARGYPVLARLSQGVAYALEKLLDLDAVALNISESVHAEALLSYFRAQRCADLARSYMLVSKYAEAYSLTQRGLEHISKSRDTVDVDEDAADLVGQLLNLGDTERLSNELGSLSHTVALGWFKHRKEEGRDIPIEETLVDLSLLNKTASAQFSDIACPSLNLAALEAMVSGAKSAEAAQPRSWIGRLLRK